MSVSDFDENESLLLAVYHATRYAHPNWQW